tara:strand:- start:374 stop:1465 length:1092 start_codon:yes stop_codon:yes gene_type:complete
MAKSDLLKEAIADAKAVRETAIANAKLALEEAFTPKLQSMLSKKISEEMEEDDDTDEMEEAVGSSEIGKGDNKAPSADASDSSDLADNVETKKETADMGEEMDEMEVEDDMNEAADAEETEEMVEAETDEMEEEETDEVYEAEDTDEMEDELAEIIKELETDDDMEVEEPSAEDVPMDEPADEPADEMAADEMADKDEMAMNDEKETDEMEEDIDIQEVIKALKEDDENDEMEEDDTDEMEEMVPESKLREAYNTISEMRKTLNEVNLLNAKLLFSNKLFRSNGLSEGQKMKVIETFDRATNVREVKLIYTTLAESFKSPVKTKKRVTEGFASKPTKGTKSAKTVISEGTTLSNRFKKLANIL